MTRSICLIIAIIYCLNNISGKDWKSSADSLERQLIFEKNDTALFEIYADLNYYLLGNDPQRAYQYALAARKIAEKLNDSVLIVRSILREVDFYNQIADYNSALQLAYDALKIAGNDIDMQGLCHNRIATVHSGLKNYEETLKHNLKCLQTASELGDSDIIATHIHNIGRTYIYLKQYDSALYYLHASNNYEISKRGRPSPYSLSNIGNVYLAQGKYDSSLYYHLEAYKYDSLDNEKYLMAIDEQYLSNVYLKQKNYSRALEMVNKSQKRLQKFGAYDLQVENYEILYKILSATGNYKKAFEYALLLDQTKDTLRKMSNQSLLLGLETRFNFQEQENKLKAKEEALLLLEKQRLLFIILSVVSILFLLSMVVIVIMVYRRHKINKELMLQLKRANESKDRMISIISHDLRSSVGTMRIAAKTISEGMADIEDTKELLESFYPVVDSTYDLLDNLLTWAKYNRDEIKPKFTTVNLRDIADKSVEHTHHLALSKSVNTINKISSYTVKADQNMILSVLRNMLSNAIKFSHPRNNVTIDMKKDSEYITVSVQDEGVGMDADVLNKIFTSPEDVHATGTMGERGSGLGISLCKTFMDIHGGKLWAESEIGKGSTFYFSLPVN
ncbi:MAG: tetratricopeptide repeat-containing sensor histidine kinase [Bacteroidales bacterium]|nr:tetratricopeptide repeat-containing sensor histidine kinase [Bacteroidales bacterium]